MLKDYPKRSSPIESRIENLFVKPTSPLKIIVDRLVSSNFVRLLVDPPPWRRYAAAAREAAIFLLFPLPMMMDSVRPEYQERRRCDRCRGSLFAARGQSAISTDLPHTTVTRSPAESQTYCPPPPPTFNTRTQSLHCTYTATDRPPTPILPHHVTFDTFRYYVLFLTHASLIPAIGKCSRVAPWIGHVGTKKVSFLEW